MPKSEGQKLALLYIQDYLVQHSDPDHPVSAQTLIDYLDSLEVIRNKAGKPMDRRTVYANIQALQEYGLDIVCQRGPNGGFYLASGTFQLPELKLLIDAVRSARFLTQRKSQELVKKLMNLCSHYDQALLRRQMLITGRVKSMNESIYYNIDTIQEAIATNRQITFQYFNWGIGRKQHFRPGPYVASPYALCIDSENYYLLAHTDKHQVTHYRVDRMAKITVTQDPRTPCPELTGDALKNYTKKMFSMFHGNTQQVKLRMKNSLVNVVYDKFGQDIMLVPDGDEYFTMTAEVEVSNMFLGWVLNFGADAQILYPESVREQCRQLCRQVLSQYDS